MKKETKLIIGEILIYLESNWDLMGDILEKLDVSDRAYLEAKKDFNKVRK
jgi:hypothetical protein